MADGDRWLGRFARTLGFGWLAERVPGTLPPSYPHAIVSTVLFTAATFVYDGIITTYGGIESAHGMPDRQGGSAGPDRWISQAAPGGAPAFHRITAEDGARVAGTSVDYPRESLREIGIQPRHPTPWTEERMERGPMADAETVEHTTVPPGFNVEVSDPFGGHVRPLHSGVTSRTMTFAHRSHIGVRRRRVNECGHGFTLGNTESDASPPVFGTLLLSVRAGFRRSRSTPSVR